MSSNYDRPIPADAGQAPPRPPEAGSGTAGPAGHGADGYRGPDGQAGYVGQARGYGGPAYPAGPAHPGGYGAPAGPAHPASAAYPADPAYTAGSAYPAAAGYPAGSASYSDPGHPGYPGGPAGPGYPGGHGIPAGYSGGGHRAPGGRARRFRRPVTMAAVALGVGLATFLGLQAASIGQGSAVLTTAQIATQTDPGLVDVVSTLGYQQAESAGTGLVLTSSGEVLTNNHVINGATSIKVTDIGNGRTYTAKVVGYDTTKDIAVLQLQGASGLQTVNLGDSSTVAVGQKVVALGNAEGKGGTPSVAAGKITGLGRGIRHLGAAERAHQRQRAHPAGRFGRAAGQHGRAGDRHRHRSVLVQLAERDGADHRDRGLRDPDQRGALDRQPDRGRPRLGHGAHRHHRVPGSPGHVRE
jgi:hypothetical protein